MTMNKKNTVLACSDADEPHVFKKSAFSFLTRQAPAGDGKTLTRSVWWEKDRRRIRRKQSPVNAEFRGPFGKWWEILELNQ